VPELMSPTPDVHRSFLDALTEHQAEGAHLDLDRVRLADAEEFGRYVAALTADVEHPGESDRYILATGHEPADPPQTEGYVPQSTLWWVDGAEYLGRIAIRHRLNDALRRHGGHIGYEVRPSARRRGHATAMLTAALPRAAALGIDPAWLDCEAANIASQRVIEKNGGRLVGEEGGSLFFRVPTR
jgi:predicted acetyltransferase